MSIFGYAELGGALRYRVEIHRIRRIHLDLMNASKFDNIGFVFAEERRCQYGHFVGLGFKVCGFWGLWVLGFCGLWVFGYS